jgi:hypothetical protein
LIIREVDRPIFYFTAMTKEGSILSIDKNERMSGNLICTGTSK